MSSILHSFIAVRRNMLFVSFLLVLIQLFAETTSGNEDLKSIVTLDEEWNVNRNKTVQDELPLAIMNIYETFTKNVTANYFLSSTVRCHFDKGKKSQLGLYTFDLSGYGRNQSISDTEMHLYISYDSVSSSSYMNYDYLVIRTYQIVPTNLTNMESSNNPDLHKLLNVAYMPSFRQGWQIFKIRMAVENWVNNGEPNLGILFTVSNKRENRIYPNFLQSSSAIYQPFLLVFDGTRENDATRTSAKKLQTNCKKEEWDIDFKEIGWENFMIQPKILRAGKCAGNCALVVKTEASVYTYLYQNLYGSGGQKMDLCCVPATFCSVPLMFYNKVDDVVIKVYDDLIVDYCECR